MPRDVKLFSLRSDGPSFLIIFVMKQVLPAIRFSASSLFELSRLKGWGEPANECFFIQYKLILSYVKTCSDWLVEHHNFLLLLNVDVAFCHCCNCLVLLGYKLLTFLEAHLADQTPLLLEKTEH